MAFAILGVAFIAGGVAFGMGLANMISQVNLQVNRLDPAVRYSSYLYNSVINQETGVRGYALTHQKSFLQPYQLGVTNEPRDAAKLHTLVDRYPKLRADLNTVLDQASRWHRDYALPAIAAVEANKPVSTASEVAGKTDFDAFRTAVRAFNREASFRAYDGTEPPAWCYQGNDHRGDRPRAADHRDRRRRLARPGYLGQATA